MQNLHQYGCYRIRRYYLIIAGRQDSHLSEQHSKPSKTDPASYFSLQLLHDMIKAAHNLQGFSSFCWKENFKADFSLSHSTRWLGRNDIYTVESFIIFSSLKTTGAVWLLVCGCSIGIKITGTKHPLLEGGRKL